MTQSLADLLIQNRPENLAGPRALSGFEYQKHWSLARLLALYVSEHDFAMVLDHHEDVAVLNKSVAPDAITFHQVKTRQTGNWTLYTLTKQESGKDGPLPSVLGRLFRNRLRCLNHAVTLSFVSNTGYGLKLGCTGTAARDQQALILPSELLEQDAALIAERLQTELGLTEKPHVDALPQFEISPLPFQGSITHLRGMLGDFFHSHYPDRPFAIVPISNALISEITHRIANQSNIRTFDDLLRYKSLSRSRFHEMLEAVGMKPDSPQWSSIEQRLNSEQLAVGQLLRLRQAWREVELDRIQRTDSEFEFFIRAMEAVIANLQPVEKLEQLMTETVARARITFDKAALYTDSYIGASAIYCLYESQQAEADSPSAQEGPR